MPGTLPRRAPGSHPLALALAVGVLLPVAPSLHHSSPQHGECSVADFGAKGDNSSDATAAFNKALQHCVGGTVIVPAGIYRLDDTVTVGTTVDSPARPTDGRGPDPPQTGTHLHLHNGAVLKRFATSDSTAPVVRVSEYGCRVTGHGVIWSENAAPRVRRPSAPTPPACPITRGA